MTTDISQVPEGLPQHLIEAMQNKQPTGLEEMAGYIVPPRLKVVQEKKDDERIQNCATGEVIVLPQILTVAKPGASFFFTPIYTWDEFCVHNPYRFKELPMIRERSIDSKSELADKARNQVREQCPESDDPTKQIKYVTHLNYLMAIHGIPELHGISVLASFFLGEFSTGQGLLNLIKLRTMRRVPMWGHVFEARVGQHKDKTGGFKWMGLNISNPTADADISAFATTNAMILDESYYKALEAAHEEAKANKERIQANYEDAVVESTPNVPEGDTL